MIILLGPYELNKVYRGECAAMMAKLPDDCIDLTVTSPPYDLVDENMVTHPRKGLRDYNGYEWDFVSVADQLWRVTKPGGVVVWVVNDATVNGSETGSSFRQALYFMKVGFSLADTMIYEVMGTGAKGSNKTYWQTYDFMFILSKGTIAKSNRIKDVKNARRGGKATRGRLRKDGRLKDTKLRIIPGKSVRGNIWRYQVGNNGDDKTGHHAQFPEALARDHILSWSNPGDIIFDSFMGSGTTAKMAIETGRQFLGFEISQDYVDLANRRIERARIPFPQMVK